jgi:endonuclease/exonuclease/phosphatase family metal-dependent hydrolase
MLKTIARIVAGIIIVAASSAAIFIGNVVTTEYRPDAIEPLVANGRADETVQEGKAYKLMTYNIGYAGLDKGRDFFMDGGIHSRSESREKTLQNLSAIENAIKGENPDIVALQEVDVDSSRSFKINEAAAIYKSLEASNYSFTFAYNYRSKFLPIPLNEPMGYSNSGLMTMSRFMFESARRMSLPGEEPIPKRYFDLKRCISENVMETAGGKKLRVVNLHLSAFDEGGAIKKLQMGFLLEYIKSIDLDKEYVILAGDWNHVLSKEFLETYKGELPKWVSTLPPEIYGGRFKLAYDKNVSTIRSTDKPYVKGVNFETVIDGFLVSDNIEVIETRGISLGFENTDHNPAVLTFRLK